MLCPKCGADNADSARFCSACGQDMSSYSQQAQPSGSPAPAPYQSAAQAPQYRAAPGPGTVPYVPSYLGWAIAVLILCFWPTGIAAVVFASRVGNLLAVGDIAGAQEASRKAKMWCWITFGIGVAIWVLSLAITIWFSWMLATRHIGAGGLFV
jgi:hypothetical protein